MTECVSAFQCVARAFTHCPKSVRQCVSAYIQRTRTALHAAETTIPKTPQCVAPSGRCRYEPHRQGLQRLVARGALVRVHRDRLVRYAAAQIAVAS